eukprot:gene36847-44697_t
MLWSENRSGSKPKASITAIEEKIRNINAVFEKLAKDEDFQDDLKLPIVEKALKHWTNQNRLPPEEAMKLQEHRRVVYVLQRFQMIQSVCRDALVPIPLDLILAGQTKIHAGIVSMIFKAHGYEFNEPSKDNTNHAKVSQQSQVSQPSAASEVPETAPSTTLQETAPLNSKDITDTSAPTSAVPREKQEGLSVQVSALAALLVAVLAFLFYYLSQQSRNSN